MSSGPARVLVTGASGVFGREITARLARAGHEVVTLSRRRPAGLPAGVRHEAADIRDTEAVTRAVDGCEAVAHCAWVVDAAAGQEDEARSVNLDGTATVLSAMDKAGARRIVFSSSMTAYGPRPPGHGPVGEDEPLQPTPEHLYATTKRDAEAMIAAAGVEGVTIRAAVVFGRSIDNRIFRALAAPALAAIKGRDSRWQVVHTDDVGRFFTRACAGDGPAGPVNLAAPGLVAAADLARLVGRPLVTVPDQPLRRTVAALYRRGLIDVDPAEIDIMLSMPIMATDRLEHDWGFNCVWAAAEAAEDTHLAVMAVRTLGPRVVGLPWRAPFPRDVPTGHEPPLDGAPLAGAAADPAQAGEFDNPIDPRFGVFTQTNLSEAVPGPSTPLTIDVCARGMSAAGAAAIDLIGLGGVVGAEAKARIQSLFGHRLYSSVSCAYVLADATPGWDADGITAQYLGRHAGEIHVETPDVPVDAPATTAGKLRSGLALAGRAGGLLAGLRADADELVAQTERLERFTAELAAVSDERLETLAWLARDLVAFGFAVAGRAAVIAGGATTALHRLAGGAEAHHLGQGETLPSAGTLLGVRTLAAEARRHPGLAAFLEAAVTNAVDPGPAAANGHVPGDAAGGAPDRTLFEHVAAVWPAYGAAIENGLRRFGHRGPAECELATRTFSDDPDLLLRTVARSLAAPAATEPIASSLPRRARPLAALTARLTAERERGRDRTVRLVWLMRRIAREQGRRLCAAGMLACTDDACFLTTAELFAPAGDADHRRELVERRRAEHERLRALTMPVAFSGTWAPEATGTVLTAGDILTGLGVSPGTVRGRARIVGPTDVYDLEAGEILVAHVTDVGYSAMFGHAGAVVTDIGGAMSHAAIVAREFGIPCVVDTVAGTARLRTGMLVEVDGEAGRVRVLAAEGRDATP